MIFTAHRLSVRVATMMLLILGMGVEAAPTERDPHPNVAYASPVKEKPSALSLKHWLPSSKAAGADGTTKSTDKTTIRTITAGIRARLRIKPETGGPDKRVRMLKMISALEELHRTLNSTLSSQLTIMARGNSRSSGRKNKALPAAEGGVKSTTAPPAAVNSTVSRASADVLNPSLTGRNLRKSFPPQSKKTNKRVCFWKYCSQN
ncbi:hypothetical protein Q5P01_005457 [Channa striata]|uniref:Urotensin II-related peptide n=1 Tax=Channa striata TaxID=64152 RepID=A0AA88T7C7_CHASR|nr:hypothetical protein Q5P01_005457 [Channa striata]